MSLGVIGGLGPMATACFLELLTEMTDAATDQEHIETIIISRPSIPDRTDYILGKSKEDPSPYLIETAVTLQNLGVSCIAVPCITARFFRDKVAGAVDIPVFHGVDYSAARLASMGVKRAGIMATDGTVKSGVISSALEAEGIEPVIPSEEGQRLVMSLIYDDVKQGREPDLRKLYKVYEELSSKGSEQVILGCTELSVIKLRHRLEYDFFDILEMLAEESVVRSGAKLLRRGN